MLTSEGRPDAGMTLAEVLVGMTLLLIVGTMSTSFFVSQSNQSVRTLNASFATSDARTSMTAIADELRLAETPTSRPGYPTDRFLTASDTQVVFFSNISANRSGTLSRTPPTKIDIHVTGVQLIEQDYAPKTAYTSYPNNYDSTYSTNYNATPTTTTLLAPRISVPATSPKIFTYHLADGSTSYTVTQANLGTITSVDITLIVLDRTSANPQTLQTSVAITGATS